MLNAAFDSAFRPSCSTNEHRGFLEDGPRKSVCPAAYSLQKEQTIDGLLEYGSVKLLVALEPAEAKSDRLPQQSRPVRQHCT
jgi:hypothetical protein